MRTALAARSPYLLPDNSDTAANVVRHEINADFIAFNHATFFSPCDSAMYDALQLGYLGNLFLAHCENIKQRSPKLYCNSQRPPEIKEAKVKENKNC